MIKQNGLQVLLEIRQRKPGKKVELQVARQFIPERWVNNSKTSMLGRKSPGWQDTQVTLSSRVKNFVAKHGRDRERSEMHSSLR